MLCNSLRLYLSQQHRQHIFSIYSYTLYPSYLNMSKRKQTTESSEAPSKTKAKTERVESEIELYKEVKYLIKSEPEEFSVENLRACPGKMFSCKHAAWKLITFSTNHYFLRQYCIKLLTFFINLCYVLQTKLPYGMESAMSRLETTFASWKRAS